MTVLQPFKPSIDWGHAVRRLAVVDRQGWVISAVCVLVVLVVLRFTTQWGRQYWRITGGYFTGRRSVRVWLMLGVLLLLVVTAVRLNVLFSYFSNDMYNALETAFEGSGAQNESVKQSGDAWLLDVAGDLLHPRRHFHRRAMVDLYLTQRFIIAWRVWLTEHLTGDWLTGHAYYRARFIDDTIDNPDQRIQQDVDIFTAGAGATPNVPSIGTSQTLLFGAVHAVVSVVSFAAILWNLSGGLTVPMLHVEIPRAMFWIVIVFVLMATMRHILDRTSPDQAELRQREAQRCLSLCVGALARRRRSGRVLPR